jgi:hypothetical protein
MRKWLGMTSRIALLLGLGTLSATSAEALPAAPLDARNDGARIPQQSARALGDVRVWSEGGRIWVAEAGKPAEVLWLGDSAEAEALRRLLEREGATAVAPRILRDRVILVGSGGAGFSWDSSAQPDAVAPPQRSDGNAK